MQLTAAWAGKDPDLVKGIVAHNALSPAAVRITPLKVTDEERRLFDIAEAASLAETTGEHLRHVQRHFMPKKMKEELDDLKQSSEASALEICLEFFTEKVEELMRADRGRRAQTTMEISDVSDDDDGA